ncbi:AAA family ATPase [Marinicellulosiphila megalodicopiae]|uniref:AAA family ATPase n=1 Tax=Marinicellulosiphila megalodicopiae TaxID=2724896 RepID=UPI003BB0CD61
MIFPFTAVEGLESLKLALLLNAVDPKIGGVLISGDKGSAKSTLARSMADLITTEQHANFTTLPLGCSVDMLLGTMDLEKVFQDKQVDFKPGLLAKAHQGILYVDEVNLLPDPLVDQLLDVAASGVNKIERDGISHEHDAQFILLGTMNPDEGQLRSQLLDRFAFQVDLTHNNSAQSRVNIIKKTQAFSSDPQTFVQTFEAEQTQLKQKIKDAQSVLAKVELDDKHLLIIANICIDAGVEGLRADIILSKAATAHAAWSGKLSVDQTDIDAVSDFVLNHRRTTPPTIPPTNPQTPPSKKENEQTQSNNKDQNTSPEQNNKNSNQGEGEDWGSMEKKSHNEILKQNLTIPNIKNIEIKKKDKTESSQHLKSNKNETSINNISWIESFKKSKSTDTSKLKNNLVFNKNEEQASVLHMVLLDTSASTLQNKTLSKSKGVIHAIANQAYLAREKICIHSFGKELFKQQLNIVKSPKDIEPFLNTIDVGGGTPVVQSLLQLHLWQKKLIKQTPELTIFTYLLTDGRTNEDINSLQPIENMVVVDLDSSVVKRSKCEHIAKVLNAQYISL